MAHLHGSMHRFAFNKKGRAVPVSRKTLCACTTRARAASRCVPYSSSGDSMRSYLVLIKMKNRVSYHFPDGDTLLLSYHRIHCCWGQRALAICSPWSMTTQQPTQHFLWFEVEVPSFPFRCSVAKISTAMDFAKQPSTKA